MPDLARRVALGGAQVSCRCHVCAFIQSDDEAYEALLPFMREGFARGDRLVQFLSADRRAERIERLAGAGLDVEAAMADGRLQLVPWEEAYTGGGRFDQHATVAQVAELGRETVTRRGVTRIWADMDWALEPIPGVGDLVAYESRVNYTLSRFDVAGVCVYDLRRFSATTIMDVLRAHPQVLANGVLQDNPFYSPPSELLPELAERETRWP